MRKQEHRYRIRELKDGFKIIPRESERPPVTCKMNKQGFWRIVEEGEHHYFNYIPLYAYYPLVDRVVDKIYESWDSGKQSNNHARELIVTNYCKKSTGKSINKVIHAIWEKKRDSLDPRVVELHKKLYSVSKGTGNWERVSHILKNRRSYKYLIDDLIRYPAARIAILHEGNVHGHILFNDWKTAYACGQEPYTSLKKTLMNFPNGVVYYNALCIKELRLPEPVTTRIRYYAYAMIARSYHVYMHHTAEKLMHVILKSTDEQIKEAVRYMWHYFPNMYSGDFRKTKGIEYAFNLIYDYPDSMIGDWDILGLAKRSELYQHDLALQEEIRQREWEEQRQRRQEESREAREKWEKEHQILLASQTALPPIALPQEKGITLLNSYQEVVQEGKLMQHCIASYAERAVKGHCYLFHVDYEGEMASVEVNLQGFVNQSYGPQDCMNKASEYGRKVLNKWAKSLANKTPVLRIPNEKEALEFTSSINTYTLEYENVEFPF